MQLKKKLSSKHFFLSMFSILIISLAFLAGLYYILNIQYKKPQNLFSNGPVTTPPKTLRLDLDQPVDDSLVFQSSVIVAGQTAPGVNVLITTETNDSVIKSTAKGSFSTVLNLDTGANRITVVIFDTTGDSKSVTRTVYYSKEKI